MWRACDFRAAWAMLNFADALIRFEPFDLIAHPAYLFVIGSALDFIARMGLTSFVEPSQHLPPARCSRGGPRTGRGRNGGRVNPHTRGV